MNAFETILEWASELGSGSWRQWREVSSYLHLNPTGAARALSDLGHVEFDWVSNRFAVAPAAAILLPRSSGSVLITGARPKRLRAQIEALASTDRFDVYCYAPIQQATGPATWLCEGALDDFPGFCETIGLVFQVQSGRELAETLSPASLDSVGILERPSDRLPRYWFDPVTRDHTLRVPPDTPGCWQVKEDRREIAYIRQGTEWHRVTVREYAPYVAYPAATFLWHDASAATLEIDARAPLPPLLARAAALQTGRLPVWASRLRYANVDQELAALIASRLSSRLGSAEVPG